MQSMVCSFRVNKGRTLKMGLGGNVVMDLTQVFVGKNYTASCEDKRNTFKKTCHVLLTLSSTTNTWEELIITINCCNTIVSV